MQVYTFLLYDNVQSSVEYKAQSNLSSILCVAPREKQIKRQRLYPHLPRILFSIIVFLLKNFCLQAILRVNLSNLRICTLLLFRKKRNLRAQAKKLLHILYFRWIFSQLLFVVVALPKIHFTIFTVMLSRTLIIVAHCVLQYSSQLLRSNWVNNMCVLLADCSH